MRIEQFEPPSVKPAQGGQPADKPADAESHTSPGPHADQVALSRLSRVLSGAVEEDPRLEQLGAAVAAGTYEVPAADLSRRLVDSHLRAEA